MDFTLPFIAFGLCLLLYILTLAPTVTSEDSGELIGAAYFFGVPHPPGYPLWTLCAGTFIRGIPFGEIAWRANLFSAVCTAIAIGILCRVLVMIGMSPLISLTTALICATGRVLWSQSVITEVYTLHFLLFVLLLWCAVRWWQSGYVGWLVLGCLVSGLGMSNHHTLGFSSVAVALWVILSAPNLIRRFRLIILCILAFAAGLMPHLYLYSRARAETPINWGETRTLSSLWDHVSRRQYKSSTASSRSPECTLSQRLVGQVGLVSDYCRREYTWPLAAVGVFGVFYLAARRAWPILQLLGLTLLCNISVFMAMNGFDFRTRQDHWTNQVFFLPMYASWCVFIGFGLEALATTIRSLSRCWESAALQKLGFASTALIILAAVAAPVCANYRINNMSSYWYAYDHAKNILDTMLPDALILPSGDHNTFPLLYLTLVEGYRADVIVADKYGYIDPPLYRDMPGSPGKPRTLEDRHKIEEWLIREARRPVYYTVKTQPLVPNAECIHVGLLYHLLPKGKTLDRDSCWSQYRYRNLEGTFGPRDFGADNIMADWEYHQGLRDMESGRFDQALDHFAKAEEYGWGIKEIANNIGSVLAEYNQIDDAIVYYERAAGMMESYEAPRWNLARIHKSKESWPAAEKAFIELTIANPQDFRPWGELGFLAARRDDAGAAIAFWHESLKRNPAQPQIIEQLHLVYSAPQASSHNHAAVGPSTQPAAAGPPPAQGAS